MSRKNNLGGAAGGRKFVQRLQQGARKEALGVGGDLISDNHPSQEKDPAPETPEYVTPSDSYTNSLKQNSHPSPYSATNPAILSQRKLSASEVVLRVFLGVLIISLGLCILMVPPAAGGVAVLASLVVIAKVVVPAVTSYVGGTTIGNSIRNFMHYNPDSTVSRVYNSWLAIKETTKKIDVDIAINKPNELASSAKAVSDIGVTSKAVVQDAVGVVKNSSSIDKDSKSIEKGEIKSQKRKTKVYSKLEKQEQGVKTPSKVQDGTSDTVKLTKAKINILASKIKSHKSKPLARLPEEKTSETVKSTKAKVKKQLKIINKHQHKIQKSVRSTPGMPSTPYSKSK